MSLDETPGRRHADGHGVAQQALRKGQATGATRARSQFWVSAYSRMVVIFPSRTVRTPMFSPPVSPSRHPAPGVEHLRPLTAQQHGQLRRRPLADADPGRAGAHPRFHGVGCYGDLLRAADDAESGAADPVAALRAGMALLGAWSRQLPGLYTVLHETPLNRRRDMSLREETAERTTAAIRRCMDRDCGGERLGSVTLGRNLATASKAARTWWRATERSDPFAAALRLPGGRAVPGSRYSSSNDAGRVLPVDFPDQVPSSSRSLFDGYATKIAAGSPVNQALSIRILQITQRSPSRSRSTA